LVFRLDLVSSPMLRGRLSIRWVPTGAPGVAGGYLQNTSHKCIVDISEQTSIDVAIGWGASVPYLPMRTVTTFPYVYALGDETYNNGTLVVEVINVLSSPMSTVESINVIVSTYALPDFELQVPTNTLIAGLRPVSEVSSLPVRTKTPNVPICYLGGRFKERPELSGTIFGERIASFRTLLKRYAPVMINTNIGSTTTSFITNITFLGLFPSKYDTALSTTYTPNLGQWLAAGYLGQRGTTRVKFVLASTSLLTAGQSNPLACQQPLFVGPMFNVTIPFGNITSNDVTLTGRLLPPGDPGMGSAIFMPTSAITEFEIPLGSSCDYFQMCFTGNVNTSTNVDAVSLTFTNPKIALATDRNSAIAYMAAGEDFSFVEYLMAPFILLTP